MESSVGAPIVDSRLGVPGDLVLHTTDGRCGGTPSGVTWWCIQKLRIINIL
jgi:hypothetical protein